MKLLLPNETHLEGKWIFDEKNMRGDETCERIEFLVSKVLKKIAVSKEYGAWETLFQDLTDSRYWEKTYPQGEMQGGRPPSLKLISREEAEEKYAIN